jgi:protein gp37
MNKSKIEWCDMTWNPVTGCLHGCPYCFASDIANRFKSRKNEWKCISFGNAHWLNGIEMPILDSPVMFHDESGEETSACAYPAGFNPTFHRYRLGEPAAVKKSKNVFVVDMGDLFGEWVPDEWIQEVFTACEAAPQHNYMFLTKNPTKYQDIFNLVTYMGITNFWLGATVSSAGEKNRLTDLMDFHSYGGKFASFEPLQNDLQLTKKDLEMGGVFHRWIDWVIVGAETGNRKDKIIPQREWVQAIVDQCREAQVPVFLKNNLADIWGQQLIQEMPEGLKHGK